MITLTYIGMFSAILILISFIDMFVLQVPFYQAFLQLFSLDKGTNEELINMVAILGLICSVIIDYRLRKNKGTNQS